MNLEQMMKNRAQNANGVVKKLNQDTATQTVIEAISNPKDITIENKKNNDICEYINELSKKQEKKRINVALSQETFEKIITASKGKSASAMMEKLLDFAVQDVEINRDVVEKYYDIMKNKCKK